MKPGWEVPPDRVLGQCVPEGYELREDEHHVYLFCGDRQVAAYHAQTPLSELIGLLALEAAVDAHD